MLIKIAMPPYHEGSKQNQFTIIDNVDSVVSRTQPFEYTSYFDLIEHLDRNDSIAEIIVNYEQVVADFDPALSEVTLSDKKVYRINQIAYKKDGRAELVIFDTIAYICNDKGETLEKCFAGGVLNK